MRAWMTCAAFALLTGCTTVGHVPWRARRDNRAAAALDARARDAFSSTDYERGTEEALRSVGIRERVLTPGNPKLADSLVTLGWNLYGANKYAEARDVFRRAADIRAAAYGEDDPRVARVLDELARTLIDLGRGEDSADLLARSTAVYRQHPRETRDFAFHLDVLASALLAHPEAADTRATLALVEHSLSIRKKRLPADDPEIAWSYESIANLSARLDDVPRAKENYERAAKTFEHRFGPWHPTVAVELHKLVNVLFLTDMDQARELEARALAIRQKAFGDADPRTAESLQTHGWMLFVRGDADGGRKEIERARTIYEASPDRMTLETAQCLQSLAAIDKSAHDYDSATREIERAIALTEERSGRDAQELGSKLRTLGAILQARSKWKEAEAPLERSMQVDTRAGSVESALLALARSYRHRGDIAGARRALERAVEVVSASGGSETIIAADALEALGTFLWQNDHEAEAKETLERALAIYEKTSGPKSRQVSICLGDLGTTVSRQGDHASALDMFEREVAIMKESQPGSHALAEAIRDVADELSVTDRHDEALAKYRDALAIDESHFAPDSREVARARAALGKELDDAGKFDEAQALLERSLAALHAHAESDPLAVAATMMELGDVLRDRGQLRAERDQYEAAVALYEKTFGKADARLIRPLHALGGAHATLADFDKAAASAEHARAIAQTIYGAESAEVAEALRYVAWARTPQGDYDAAQAALRRALAIRETTSGPVSNEYAAIVNDLAGVERARGDSGRARKSFEQAAAIYRANAEKTGTEESAEVVQTESNLALTLADLGENAAALPTLEATLAYREKHETAGNSAIGVACDNLAATLFALGKLERARELETRAVDIQSRALGDSHPRTAAALARLARIDAALGRDQESKAELTHAITLIEGWLDHNIDSMTEREQILFFARYRWVLDQFVAAATAAEAGAAYEHVLHWKGAAELIASARQIETWSHSDSGGEPVARLREVKSTLGRLSLEGAADRSRKHEEQMRQLNEEASHLESEIAAASAGYRQRAAFLGAGSKEICGALGSDAALLDYVIHRSGTRQNAPMLITAFTMTHDSTGDGCVVRRRDLESSEPVIAGLVSSWEAAVARGLMAPALKRGAALRAAIFDPVERDLRGRRTILLVPDGALATVSFAALPARGGTTEPRFLLESLTFSYLDSGKDLLRTSLPAPGGALPPLVIGGADFRSRSPATDAIAVLARANTNRIGTAASVEPEHPPSTVRGSGCLPETFADLPGARAEGEAVARTLGDETAFLSGADASELVFRALAPHRSILHIASHGFFASENCLSAEGANPMLLSGLAFAGASARNADASAENDGLLTAADLAGLDLRGTSLVVLSACDTGRGRSVAGQGVMGLRRAVLTAGVPSLVMSLWRVPDDETRELMGLFYENLRAKMPPRDALRRAQLEMLRRLRSRDQGAAIHLIGAFVHAG